MRALGRAGAEAAPDLARVLRSADVFTPSERAEAARVLKRLGSSGQKTLQATLGSLVPASDAIASTALGEEIGVLLATLGSMDVPGKATKELKTLATLAPPPAAPLTVLRRLSWIRCSAAERLAGSDPRDANTPPTLIVATQGSPPFATIPEQKQEATICLLPADNVPHQKSKRGR